MQIISKLEELSYIIKNYKSQGKKIGFVPTMGYLHQGHLKLVEEAKKKSDIVVVSIFINPAQFNDPEDLKKYPLDIEGDIKKCEAEGVDLVFLPTVEEIYPEGIPNIIIKIPHLMGGLCGKSRPGHFEGVLLVLGKLFHAVQPDLLFMGKKDYQQFKIVSYFIQHLGFPIQLYGIDTVREEDGLAMSSRNARLNNKEREAALLIHRTLSIAEKVWMEGERNPKVLKEILMDILASDPLIQVDYLEFVDLETLQEVDNLNNPFLIAIAVFCGKVRLIDNKEIGTSLNKN